MCNIRYDWKPNGWKQLTAECAVQFNLMNNLSKKQAGKVAVSGFYGSMVLVASTGNTVIIIHLLCGYFKFAQQQKSEKNGEVTNLAWCTMCICMKSGHTAAVSCSTKYS